MARKSAAIADIEAKKAPHGEKMIEVKFRFFTNAIAVEDGKIVPKHAAAGVVRIERNEAHGITPGSPKPFHSLFNISLIERVLIDHESSVASGQANTEINGSPIDGAAYAERKRRARKGAKSLP